MTNFSLAARFGAMFALAAVLAGAPASAQTLRFGLAEDPDVLDPTLARTFVGRIVFAALLPPASRLPPTTQSSQSAASESAPSFPRRCDPRAERRGR